MKQPTRMTAAVVALLGLLPAIARAVNIPLMPVGNAGNANDTTGRGGVPYAYQIGKFEVTAGQYTEFLNKVAATDTYGLYNPKMGGTSTVVPVGPPVQPDLSWGCGIQQSSSSGSYTYSVAADWANRPVNHVSWGDAARFVNWLRNGQPSGPQGNATTEDGSYYLNGATSVTALMAVTRKPGATWVLPTENEWYKAAYHKNDGVTGNYWDYPTRSNSQPINTLLTPDPGNNANYFDYYHTGNWGYTIGSPYWATEAGAFTNSDSPYGTFDQAGNVWEWNETKIGNERGNLGGGWNEDGWFSIASNRYSNDPTSELDFRFGFRVASVPEPGSFSLIVGAATVAGVLRRRRLAGALHHAGGGVSAPEDSRNMHMTLRSIATVAADPGRASSDDVLAGNRSS